MRRPTTFLFNHELYYTGHNKKELADRWDNGAGSTELLREKRQCRFFVRPHSGMTGGVDVKIVKRISRRFQRCLGWVIWKIIRRYVGHLR
jgi:hypothetical protein